MNQARPGCRTAQILTTPRRPLLVDLDVLTDPLGDSSDLNCQNVKIDGKREMGRSDDADAYLADGALCGDNLAVNRLGAGRKGS